MGEFCGCSKQKWGLNLGITLAVLLAIEFILILICRGIIDGKGDGGDEANITFMVYLFGFGTVTLLGIIASCILIAGVIKMRKWMLMAWIVCGILLALAYIAFLGVTFFRLRFNDKWSFIDLPIILIILTLIILAEIVAFGLKNEAE